MYTNCVWLHGVVTLYSVGLSLDSWQQRYLPVKEADAVEQTMGSKSQIAPTCGA